MLYLNLLNRIFGQKKLLSRDDISRYKNNTDQKEKQAIEEQALSHSFDSEALEGWDNYNPEKVLTKLDRRFNRKKRLYINTTIIAVISLTLISTYLILQKNKKATPLVKNDKTILTLDKKSSVTKIESEKIKNEINNKSDALKVIEKDLRINKEDIIILQSKKEVEIVDTLLTDQTIPTLKVIEPKINETIEKLDYRNKKEIYLYDLKLIDYTAYRNTPIKTKTLALPGTAANLADKESVTEEEVWKTVDISYADYLDKTMRYFSKEKYKKALLRFEVILKNYPNDVNANFYGGLSYYNLNNSTKALQLIENAYSTEFGNFREEANWITYLIYKKSNNLLAAENILNKIIAEDGYYKNEAATELVEIKRALK